ncbi:MAG: hypothetical protein K2O91_01670 [Lachnospiraceae bacterium]|nr:hypothetical protein [Lachnospiraceae bacterium]
METKIMEMNQEGAEESSSTAGQTQEALDIKNGRMEVSYLPEGMIETEEGKYSCADAL